MKIKEFDKDYVSIPDRYGATRVGLRTMRSGRERFVMVSIPDRYGATVNYG